MLQVIGLAGVLCCMSFVLMMSAFAVLGLAWSPLAALTCRHLAVNGGLAPGHYARLGAFYSLHLFLPWVYLVNRMRGTRLSRKLIVGVYFFLFGGWFCVSILGNLVVGVVLLAEFVSDPQKYQFHPYTYIIIVVMMIVPFTVNLVLWTNSAGNLRRQSDVDQSTTGIVGKDFLEARSFPAPFIVVWLVLTLFLGVVLYYIGLDSGEPTSLAFFFPLLFVSPVLVLVIIAYSLVGRWLDPQNPCGTTAPINSEGRILLARAYLRPFPDALLGTVLSFLALPAVLGVTFFGSL